MSFFRFAATLSRRVISSWVGILTKMSEDGQEERVWDLKYSGV